MMPVYQDDEIEREAQRRQVDAYIQRKEELPAVFPGRAESVEVFPVPHHGHRYEPKHCPYCEGWADAIDAVKGEGK